MVREGWRGYCRSVGWLVVRFQTHTHPATLPARGEDCGTGDIRSAKAMRGMLSAADCTTSNCALIKSATGIDSKSSSLQCFEREGWE